jgi:hypothetical protein
LMRVTDSEVMALSYEPEGTPATEEAGAIGGYQGYLARKVEG